MSSPLLSCPEIVCGFSTREGGVSQGPFASLNLSDKVGDDPQAVAQNRHRLSRRVGVSWAHWVGLNQVHGAEVLCVDRPVEQLPPEDQRSFDALITARDDVLLSVRTADCVPVLIHAPDGPAVAAVHAGWRGSLAGVAARAVEAMAEAYGCRPSGMLAAIGPCIGPERFEVGLEVFEPFVQAFGDAVALRRAGGLFVDLIEANRRVLLGAGLESAHIDSLDLCTCSLADRFFSHRRDAGCTGRQVSFIGLASQAAAQQDED